MNNREKLYHLISHVLGVDITEINEATSPENTQSWDSFNALVMVTELEESFNVTFTMDEIESVRNVGDIIEVLSSYSISFD